MYNTDIKNKTSDMSFGPKYGSGPISDTKKTDAKLDPKDSISKKDDEIEIVSNKIS